jgi:alkaline phosphatase
MQSAATLLCVAVLAPAFAQTPVPSIKILLPERTRLLQGQLVDLVIEVRNAASVSGLSVFATGGDLTSRFGPATRAELDCDSSTDWVYRANLQSFNSPGTIELIATVNAGGIQVRDRRVIEVLPFANPNRRNIILFIGDAMGTAYRDAIRLVDKTVVTAGKPAYRAGFFDDLLEMDKMPVSGMVMTYGTDSIVPDSANTAAAWTTGNKTFLNAINVFEDGTDCRWRFTGTANAANLPFMRDNPRVENLWQYLKRNYGYRAGIVSTAAITDATPAAEGSYVAFRQQRYDIALQYRENPMLNGAPAFDVILGGGSDPFTARGRTDGRDLIAEFVQLGYRYVTNATQLNAITGNRPLLGLFKGSANPAPASDGIRTAADVNMDVAYDKLGLQKPASEPLPNFAGFTDQPMLEDMTRVAINVLADGGQPFILMVEAASIDKQSHPNNLTGTIWDGIELDRAVGVARRWANAKERKDTLIVVTADHDQSMSIIGVANIPDVEYFDRNKNAQVSFTTPRGNQQFNVWGDSYSNARAGLPFINGSTDARNNSGPGGMPGTFAPTSNAANPAASTYSTYFGAPAYLPGPKGYPANSGAGLRRLAVGFRTGDHTGSSVPLTAEGPGAAFFMGYMDQTEIMFKMAMAVSMDTSAVDQLVDLVQKTIPKTPGK